jgi:hypothetical protein
MQKIAVKALVLFLSILSPAWAQADPPKERLIRDLLAITRTEALADQMIAMLKPQMIGLVMTQLRTLIPNQDAEVAQIVDEAYAREFGKLRGEFMTIWIAAYDRHFSVQELTDLNTFYRTPLDQMTIDKMPKLQAELMQVGQVAGTAAGQRAAADAVAKLQEKGKLPARAAAIVRPAANARGPWRPAWPGRPARLRSGHWRPAGRGVR